MKRAILVISAGLMLMCLSAEAQYVIEPCVEGTARWHAYRNFYHTYSGGSHSRGTDHYYGSPGTFKAGWVFTSSAWGSGGAWGRSSTLDHFQPVIEFHLNDTTGGSQFPLSQLTSNNFSAHLMGIQAGDVSGEDTSNLIELYQLPVEQTDGVLTKEDHAGQYGDFQYLATLWQGKPEDYSIVDPIDVTKALKVNLFGVETTDRIGFAIDKWDYDLDGYQINIPIQQNAVRLQINIGTPCPTSTPTPVPPPVVNLALKNYLLHPGEEFSMSVTINRPGELPRVLPLVVMLEIGSEYYFHPVWTDEFNYEMVNLGTPVTEKSILEFIWPETDTVSAGNFVYAALLSPKMDNIYSNVDMISFGWIG